MWARTGGSMPCRAPRSGGSKRLPGRCSANKKPGGTQGATPPRDDRMTDANPGMPAPAVAVVVPVRNEAGNVAPLIAEIAAALAGRAFEVIAVNDGSTDQTEAELRRLQGQYSWLRQMRHARSCGQSAALRTGMLAARGTIVA